MFCRLNRGDHHGGDADDVLQLVRLSQEDDVRAELAGEAW